jgi:hypothetical protein
MARQLCFFVLIGLAAFIVCGVAVFYSHRSAHGTTVEERAAYESGEKAGEEAPPGATLPTEAELDVMAQKCFEQQARVNSSEILREQVGWRLVSTLSKRVTPPGSRKRIQRSDDNHLRLTQPPLHRTAGTATFAPTQFAPCSRRR